MGRFALQQDQWEEEEYSDVDSHEEGSPERWSSVGDERRRSHFWRSECPSSSHSMASSSSTFHRALTRFRRGPLEDGEIPEDIDVIPQEEEDEDSYTSHQRQLTGYQQPPIPQYHLNHSNPTAPIHYHIYYTPPPQPHQQPLSHSSTPWKWIAIAAVLSHIAYVYGPSARTFQESGLSPLTELMATCWFALYQVVWKYTDNSQVDWQFWRKNDMDHTTEKDSGFMQTTAECVSTVDKWPLFGQRMVMDAMKEALDNRSRYNTQRPLVFYAVGGPGVGKRFTAQLLAESCSSSLVEVDLSTVTKMDDLRPIIRNQLMISMDDTENFKSTPTVLLLSHLSLDEPSHTSAVLENLGTLFHEFPDWWRNVILVVTSHSGAATIDKAIRHYGKNSLPMSHEEVVLYLGQSLSLQFHPEWASSSAILLPFVPLDRLSVQTMIQSLLPMTIGLDDLNDLLDTTLEWETWIDRPTQVELYTFLPKGGHDVMVLIDRLMPPESCGAAAVASGGTERLDKDVTWLKVKNGNQLHLEYCDGNGDSPCSPICQYTLV